MAASGAAAAFIAAEAPPTARHGACAARPARRAQPLIGWRTSMRRCRLWLWGFYGTAPRDYGASMGHPVGLWGINGASMEQHHPRLWGFYVAAAPGYGASMGHPVELLGTYGAAPHRWAMELWSIHGASMGPSHPGFGASMGQPLGPCGIPTPGYGASMGQHNQAMGHLWGTPSGYGASIGHPLWL